MRCFMLLPFIFLLIPYKSNVMFSRFSCRSCLYGMFGMSGNLSDTRGGSSLAVGLHEGGMLANNGLEDFC